jgi:dolichol-phosphate mannosyltransferase
MKRVLILIPTYNESESIVELIERICAIKKILDPQYSIEILIIDGNSPDMTAQIASNRFNQELKVLLQNEKNGIGPAYKAGFKQGLMGDYEFFVEMDADLSHQPEQLPRLLAAANAKTLVIGTRWIEDGAVLNWPKRRRIISKFGTAYASKMLGLKHRDLTSGYRVLPRQLLESIDLTKIKTTGYGFQIEIALRAVRAGFDLAQVPITFIERRHGRSKMNRGIVFEAWKMVTVEALKRLIQCR